MDSPEFLRPEQLEREFVAESFERVDEEGGGYREEWKPFDTTVGVLASANTREMMMAQQLRINTSHVIVCRGAPVAGPQQRLRLRGGASDRFFRIDYVDNPGDLNHWALYYAEEVFPTEE